MVAQRAGLTLLALGLTVLGCSSLDAPGLEPSDIVLVQVPDTLSFDALGVKLPLDPQVWSVQQRRVNPARLRAVVRDPSIASVSASFEVTAQDNGATWVVLVDSASAVAGSTVVRVNQRARSVGISLAKQFEMVLLAPEGVENAVWAKDRNGQFLPGDRLAVEIQDSTGLQVDAAGQAFGLRSGSNALIVRVDGLEARDSFTVVVPPRVTAPSTAGFSIAGLPDSMVPWAPTGLARNGGVTLYFAGYAWDSVFAAKRADLHYATSADGIHFTYQGVALQRDSAYYDYRSQGVENVFIVPRDDGPGCRMYASAGSVWWIWMVFSATSQTCTEPWTWEDGPAVPGIIHDSVVARPTGEGMHAWQDSTGTWWMILAAYPPGYGDLEQWSIGLYRGTAQRDWEFVKTLVRPATPGHERAAFAPSVVEFAPGIYRMFYAGDADGSGPGGPTGRIYSMVSRDRLDWVPEGVVLDLGLPDRGPTYSTVVGNQLYHIVHSQTVDPYLSAATIEQP